MAAPHEVTHFLSLELNNDHQLIDKIEELQDQLQNQLYGERLGKRYKRKALHITMAVLSLDEHSIKLAEEVLTAAWTKFKMQLFGDEGFLLTLKGLGMHDHSSLYAKVDIGQQMLATLRGCIEDHLLWAITDKQFDNGHVTLFRNNTMLDRELAPLLNSFKEYNISMMVARKVVLRVMKKKAEQQEIPMDKRELVSLSQSDQ